MCELRCLTPENLDREIAVAVLGYNLVRVLMCDTAAVQEVHPREISFSSARDAWLAFHDERETTDDIAWIIHSTASHFVRNRPAQRTSRNQATTSQVPKIERAKTQPQMSKERKE